MSLPARDCKPPQGNVILTQMPCWHSIRRKRGARLSWGLIDLTVGQTLWVISWGSFWGCILLVVYVRIAIEPIGARRNNLATRPILPELVRAGFAASKKCDGAMAGNRVFSQKRRASHQHCDDVRPHVFGFLAEGICWFRACFYIF